MATVTEEAVAVPAVGANEAAEVVTVEKVEDGKEAGAGVEKADGEVKMAEVEGEQGTAEAKMVREEKVDEVKEVDAAEEKADGEGEVKEVGAAEEKADGEGEVKKGEGETETAKAKKPRNRKPRSEGPHHPPYFDMIKEAIIAAGDGKAEASTYAIAKHVGERHGEALPGNYRKVLAVQLRNFAAKGRLVRVKASFRLAPAEAKKASKKGRAKTSAKKGAPKEGKKAAPARAKRAKKVAPPANPKPKQPRSIRSGAARKANKASA